MSYGPNTPADGEPGARRIVAIVEQDGFPRASVKVASFRAGEDRPPAAPRRVFLGRRGSTAVARWRKAPRAQGYAVTFSQSDGRRETHFVAANKTRTILEDVPQEESVKVVVEAVGDDNVRGRGATASIKALRPKEKRDTFVVRPIDEVGFAVVHLKR